MYIHMILLAYQLEAQFRMSALSMRIIHAEKHRKEEDPMRYFIVASHGPLSTAILESASLIAGKETFRNFRAIYVTMQDSPENIRQTVDNCMVDFPEEAEIIALTDVFGGSVTNILTEYIQSRNLHIVTGMNLGMVIDAGFSGVETSTEELIEALIHTGQRGIRCVNSEIDNNELEDEI